MIVVDADTNGGVILIGYICPVAQEYIVVNALFSQDDVIAISANFCLDFFGNVKDLSYFWNIRIVMVIQSCIRIIAVDIAATVSGVDYYGGAATRLRSSSRRRGST